MMKADVVSFCSLIVVVRALTLQCWAFLVVLVVQQAVGVAA